jgi:organic radical activating enzyme
MINPSEMKLIQLIVTHKCPYRCSNCSQMIGHHKKPFEMTLDEIENGLSTLVDYPGHIGIFGGEPTMHPDFEGICKLLKKYVPVKARRELWTMGHNWKKYKSLIKETFYDELIAYNEHWEYQPCFHQPLQVAIKEVIPDSIIMWKIIENCWVQQRWSAAITPKGAFFCEVAASRAHIFDWDVGVKVKEGWWKKSLGDFTHQIHRACPKCSACLPMPMIPNDKQEYDDVSEKLLNSLVEARSPKVQSGKVECFDIGKLQEYLSGHDFKPITDDYWNRGGFVDFPDWKPWNYREVKKHGPENKHNNTNEKQTKTTNTKSS